MEVKQGRLVELISIGDELLIGQTINTNAGWLGAELTQRGFRISRVVTISDTEAEIVEALNEAKERVNVVIVTGGLGPTTDDITKKTLADYFSTHLERDPEVLQRITDFFSRRGREMLEVNRQQADLPVDAKILDNIRGTAMGMWFEKEGFHVISLPGVPYEMKGLMREHVFELLHDKFDGHDIEHRTVHTVGVGESFLAELIGDWAKSLHEANLGLAYLPSPGLVRLRITATEGTQAEMQTLLNAKVKELEQIIPEHIFGYGDTSLPKEIGKLLLEHKSTISTAESCTGGNIAHFITSIAGSSAYYQGSLVSYSNEVKMNELGVTQSDLDQHGAVSQPVVEQMAKGVRARLDTDYAIATSGIAGPDGGTEEKPVGTVWIAVASKDKVHAQKFTFGRSRERNILLSTIYALNLCRLMIIGRL